MAQKLKLRMGLERVKKPLYASQSDFVSLVNAQMKAVQNDLEYIMEQFEDVTPEITLEALRPTFELSQLYVPKDTMALHDSGYLEIVSFRGNPKVEIGYAKGGKPEYAPYVHEMTTYHHKSPTSAKFLERAVNEDIGNIIDRVYYGYQRFMNG